MMQQQAQPSPATRPHWLWWLIALSLVVIAFNTMVRDDGVLPPAYAQGVRSAGARGIFAFTGQLAPNNFGLFMVDVDAGTIWCYEMVNAGGVKKLRLLAGRSWIFDRYLENYNLEVPLPDEVRELVEQQRADADKGQQGTP